MSYKLTKQKVRAKISFGNITVETPDVVSFHVTRQRGQPSASFSASVKVDAEKTSSIKSMADTDT